MRKLAVLNQGSKTSSEKREKNARQRRAAKMVKDVLIGLTASTASLDGTNESLQRTKKDFDALCIQLGFGQVSHKYFLASMQDSSSVNNLS